MNYDNLWGPLVACHINPASGNTLYTSERLRLVLSLQRGRIRGRYKKVVRKSHQESDEAKVGVAVAEIAEVEDTEERLPALRQLCQRLFQQMDTQPLAVVQRILIYSQTIVSAAHEEIDL